MGSDLYNNLIRYFVSHLKTLREVRTLVDLNEWASGLILGNSRHRTRSRTKNYSDITLASGIGTPPARTT